jgi:rhodanese-related sulfurtransferase/CBS domain-containing protein
MPATIDRQQLQILLGQGAQLVEVLPHEEYEAEHLPGAINIPLTQLDRISTARLDRDRPLIVYCYDYQWDLSARAAWRLESLGFGQVHRYEAGKADWSAAGLPREGKEAHTPRAGDVARHDVPTCRLSDRLDVVRARVQTAGWDTCLVVNEAGVVLGRLGRKALYSGAGGQAVVEETMKLGPSTYRPDVPLGELAEHMRTHDLTTAPITTSDGVLVGLVFRHDAERRFHESHAAPHRESQAPVAARGQPRWHAGNNCHWLRAAAPDAGPQRAPRMLDVVIVGASPSTRRCSSKTWHSCVPGRIGLDRRWGGAGPESNQQLT